MSTSPNQDYTTVTIHRETRERIRDLQEKQSGAPATRLVRDLVDLAESVDRFD